MWWPVGTLRPSITWRLDSLVQVRGGDRELLIGVHNASVSGPEVAVVDGSIMESLAFRVWNCSRSVVWPDVDMSGVSIMLFCLLLVCPAAEKRTSWCARRGSRIGVRTGGGHKNRKCGKTAELFSDDTLLIMDSMRTGSSTRSILGESHQRFFCRHGL